MAKRTDLRVIKTERAIYNALTELLMKKDLEKITISELAEKAEINKATFYLHYSDIYSLYQKMISRHIKEIIVERKLLENMLSDPEEFSRRLIEDFFSPKMMSNDPFFHNPSQVQNRTISYHICNAFTEQAIVSGLLPDTRENILKLEFFFTGAAFLRQQHQDKEEPVIIGIMASSIRNLFL